MQDRLVINARPALVLSAVHVLDVHKAGVQQRRKLCYAIVGAEQVKLRHGVDTVLLAFLEQSGRKVGLKQDVSAAERYTTAGMEVEQALLPNLPHYFLHCHKLTIYAHSMGGAYVGTAEAFHAFCPVMDQCCPVLRDGQRLFGACPDTAPTVQTLRLLVVPFRFGGLSLRCGAPRTAQRAAF